MSKISSLNELQRAHIIGIGGSGMSGLAVLMHESGCTVTGSDLKSSRYVRELEDYGIDVRIGHDAAVIDELEPEVVIPSTAVPETNPELVRALERGIEVWPRSKVLAALSADKPTIAVAGTHGKTTTSSMISVMLDKCGMDPAFLIGGIVEGYDITARGGKGPFVVEADESDGTFLHIHPHLAVVTNMEPDHLEHWGDFDDLKQGFFDFMDGVGDEGAIICCAESPELVGLARSTGRKLVTYGFAADCDYRCEIVSTHGVSTDIRVSCPSGATVPVTIQTNPGPHNALNAAASIAAAEAMGLDAAAAAEALSEFKGVHRRFTHVDTIGDVTIVDDYGHHPTEIRVTLEAASKLGYGRVICIFQPHRYTRTQALFDEFTHIFDTCDIVYVMEIFSAWETPIPGISGKSLAKSIRTGGKCPDVRFISSRSGLIDDLCEEARPGDLVITMGCGDVTLMSTQFAETYADWLAQRG